MQKLSNRRVLIVEDEGLVSMLLEDMLVDAGADVLGPAGTVAAAMAILERDAPDVAILDVNLAGETSAPVAARLVERAIPFIVATGYGDKGVPGDHGGAPVFAKPFDLEEIVGRLASLADAAPRP